MSELLFRSSSEFEVEGDGRTLTGIAARYDVPAKVIDPGMTERYWEEFDPNSAMRTLKQRAERPLFVRHEHLKGSVGETTFEHSQAEGALLFRARMADTKYGQRTLGRVNDGELPAVSLGFRSIRHHTRSDPRGPVTRRLEIAVEELSLAEIAQHEGTLVLSVRSEGVTVVTPRLDELRRRKLLLPVL
jgi:HK97 family phage prohead protease